jgi:predicted amidophosphoribosyltransferase
MVVRAASEGVSTRVSSRGGSGAMMAVVASDERVGCPTCGQEYDGSLRFCPADARPLVPESELAKLAGKSALCTACGRSFERGVPRCPNDGTELTPQSLYEATRGRPSVLHPTGITGRICPLCRRRYDLAARFCPVDGAELATIN